MTDDLLALLRAAGAEGISSTPNAIDGMRYQTKANALCAEAAAVIERQAARIARLEERTENSDAAYTEWEAAAVIERQAARIARLEAALRQAQEALEQAMNYIHDETPEVGTVEDARDDTLWKIRDADRSAAAALADAPVGPDE